MSIISKPGEIFIILTHAHAPDKYETWWYLVGDPGGGRWWRYKDWCGFLGLKVAQVEKMGPFRTKEEAQAIAKENGWTIITPERMARLIRAQGYDPHAITLHRDPWRRL